MHNAGEAAARIRAEVSGLPPGKWERRLMMFAQAAIDDSGNEAKQDVFVLAGFVAPAVNWIQFTLAWDKELKSKGLEYFKYSEAMRLRGQFDKDKGWTATRRDAQLEAFSEIISNHVTGRFFAALRHEHFHRYVRDAAPARVRSLFTDHPYLLLAARVAVSATVTMIARRLTDPCAFYFDTQPGQDVVLRAIWPNICAAIAHETLDLPEGFERAPPILAPPVFASEKDWFPLQAADLLAGALRSEIMTGVTPEPVRKVGEIMGFGQVIEEEELKARGLEIVEMMDQFRAAHPEIELFYYDEETAARRRKLARKGPPPSRTRKSAKS